MISDNTINGISYEFSSPTRGMTVVGRMTEILCGGVSYANKAYSMSEVRSGL